MHAVSIGSNFLLGRSRCLFAWSRLIETEEITIRLHVPFLRFPLEFDVDRLKSELGAFSEADWLKHPQSYTGNSAIPLVSSEPDGHDGFAAPFYATDFLRRSPYFQQVLAAFGTVVGRARLMRLAPGASVPPHVDIHHYWRNRIRVHIPIVTDESVVFTCADKTIHMGAGEAWTFDNWQRHKVHNPSDVWRVHLVFDTYGTAKFWRLAGSQAPPKKIRFSASAKPALALERHGSDSVFSPDEIRNLINELVADASQLEANAQLELDRFSSAAEELCLEWRSIYSVHGNKSSSIPFYKNLLTQFYGLCHSQNPSIKLASNGMYVNEVFERVLKGAVRARDTHGSTGHSHAATVRSNAARDITVQSRGLSDQRTFDRPVFVVAAPRSGSSWLFEMLSEHPDLFTLGGEGHQHVESIRALRPGYPGVTSNRLDATHATAEVGTHLKFNYLGDLRDCHGRPIDEIIEHTARFRFLEKTPKNALRIPFLKTIFPDAKFVFLYREGRQNVSSIMEAWRSGRFVTYRKLPQWTGELPWSMALIPGWEDLAARDLADIALVQWREINRTIMEDLSSLAPSDWMAIGYNDLKVANAMSMAMLAEFMDIEPSFYENLEAEVSRPSRYTLTPPSDDKWKLNADCLSPHFEQIDKADEALAKFGQRS